MRKVILAAINYAFMIISASVVTNVATTTTKHSPRAQMLADHDEEQCSKCIGGATWLYDLETHIYGSFRRGCVIDISELPRKRSAVVEAVEDTESCAPDEDERKTVKPVKRLKPLKQSKRRDPVVTSIENFIKHLCVA